jgi:hypothetical protein
VPPIERLAVHGFTIPTEEPESDGTLAWHSTTVVVVEVEAGGQTGVGYTYGHEAAAVLIQRLLADFVVGRDALDVAGAWDAMVAAVRNIGRHAAAAPTTTRAGSPPPATPSARTPSCTSTPTAPTPASRRSRCRRRSPTPVSSGTGMGVELRLADVEDHRVWP